MSLSYHFKKAFTSVFASKNGVKSFIVGATLAFGGAYGGAELVLKDASQERTAPYGDAQMAALEKSYQALLAQRDAGKRERDEAMRLRQESIVNPTTEGAQALAQMERKGLHADSAFRASKQAFFQNVLISEGISEVDARKLLRAYETDLGAQSGGMVLGGSVFGHAYSYIDECQKENEGGSLTTDGYAAAVDRCLYRTVQDRAVVSGLAAIFSGLGGLGAFSLLGGLAGRLRRSVEAEEERRRREREQKKLDAERGITREEASFRLTIEKPKTVKPKIEAPKN